MPQMPPLTETQLAFLKMLTDQRVANIVQASDLIGDMGSEALDILLALSDDERKVLRQCFWRINPETLRFLMEMRADELDELKAAVETYIAIKRTMRVVRWGVATLIGAFLTILILWERMSGALRGGK